MDVKEAAAEYLPEVVPQTSENEVSPGYKRTEVGMIPREWAVKPLSKIAPLQRGFDLSSTRREDGPYPVIYSNGTLATNTQFMVRGPGVATGRSGTLGAVHYVELDFWPHNTSLWVTRFNGNDPKFIYYLFNRIGFERFASGSGVPTLNRNDAHAFLVAIPCAKAEQRAIAEALSDADALIAALQRLIAKKRAIKQGAMQALLTGRQRLPGFTGEWETKTLDQLGTFRKGQGVSRAQAQSGRLPCVRYGELYTTHHDYVRSFMSRISAEVAASSSKVGYGDILFAGSGETKEEIGKCAAIVENITAYAGGDIVVFHLKRGSALFFGYALNTTEVNRQKASLGQGDAVVHISSRALKCISMTIPDPDEQTAIATALSDMDVEIEALEPRLTKTCQLKDGMMQQLLTGHIRLVEPDTAVQSAC